MIAAPTRTPIRIVIIGGGFAGIETARRLGRRFRRSDAVRVTLVSRDNYFLFQPLLPEVVACGIEPAHILNPIRHLCRDVHHVCRTVEAVDLRSRYVTLGGTDTEKPQCLSYDHLILCPGHVVGASPVPGMNEHALPLKTLGDAFQLRNHILSRLEEAECSGDETTRRRVLTFVTIGGGFSGVETAGAVNDFIRDVSPYYPYAQAMGHHSILIHAGDRILGELDPALAWFAERTVKRRGVDVRIKTRVDQVTRERVITNDGRSIGAGTVISTVGNALHPLVRGLGLPLQDGRILVDECLRVRGCSTLWALGDVAAVPDLGKGRLCPPTAQYAVRQGRQCADNVAAVVEGGEPTPFRYHGRGQMAVIGKQCGVAQIGQWTLSGPAAWLLWRAVYLAKLPGIRCRLRVALDWLLDLLFPRDITKLDVRRTDLLQRAHFSQGDLIVRQGEEADCFYLIESGEVEVIKDIPGEPPERLRVCSAGDTFGELAILRNAARTATVRCLTSVDVLKVSRHDFLTMFGGYTAFRAQIRETVGKYTA